ncbi:MAG TPA: tyrosine-type recombinase/integrase [Blastocatellia bacterium]|nr:tyrosine-type recombinase/integrase [Blastocatellia bacterium]
MNEPTLASLLSAFFVRYLASERGVSQHTIVSYRDSIKLLLKFAASQCKRSVDQLSVENLTASLVLDFLMDLETNRGNSTRTRNSRLAAIHSFFRYVIGREPALAALCSPILAVPFKKAIHPILGYLNEQELHQILTQIDRSAKNGERDYVLLSLLYDTGARIQELLDVTPRNFHLESPPFVRVRGKGNRERFCPLLPQSARLVQKFLSTQGRRCDEQEPLFQSRPGIRLSRHGARYILLKYLRQATISKPSLARTGISPHTLRHTKAMHLLQSGVPLVMVKDFLGHVDLKSTEIYVQADLDMKRNALELANGPQATQPEKPKLAPSLIDWLESL